MEQLTAEQIEMIAFLGALRDAAESVCRLAERDSTENETLAALPVHRWENVRAANAEAYINSDGEKGYRVTIAVGGTFFAGEFRKFGQYMTDQLAGLGFADIKAVFE